MRHIIIKITSFSFILPLAAAAHLHTHTCLPPLHCCWTIHQYIFFFFSVSSCLSDVSRSSIPFSLFFYSLLAHLHFTYCRYVFVILTDALTNLTRPNLPNTVHLGGYLFSSSSLPSTHCHKWWMDNPPPCSYRRCWYWSIKSRSSLVFCCSFLSVSLSLSLFPPIHAHWLFSPTAYIYHKFVKNIHTYTYRCY